MLVKSHDPRVLAVAMQAFVAVMALVSLQAAHDRDINLLMLQLVHEMTQLSNQPAAVRGRVLVTMAQCARLCADDDVIRFIWRAAIRNLNDKNIVDAIDTQATKRGRATTAHSDMADKMAHSANSGNNDEKLLTGQVAGG